MREFLEDYGMAIFAVWAMILITALIGSFVFVIVSSVFCGF